MRKRDSDDVGLGQTVLPRQLMRLEERIVLDAAAVATGPDPHLDVAGTFLKAVAGGTVAPGAHVTDFLSGAGATSPDGASHAGALVDAPPSGSEHDPVRLLAISSRLNQADVLAGAAADGVTTVIFDPDAVSLEALLAQIRSALAGRPADEIALATHGIAPGRLELAGGAIANLETLHDPALRHFWAGLGGLLTPDGRIDLLACDVAQSTAGQALLGALEAIAGANVAASTDATGNAHAGGNWTLESDGVDAGAYFNPGRLAEYTSLLADTAPTLTDSDPGTSAVGGGAAVVVDPGLTVTDADPLDTLTGATVRIRGGFEFGQDRLWYDDSPGGPADAAGITGSYDASTGTLAFSGFATADAYQAVLRTVTYRNDDLTPNTTPREILFTIGDNFGGHAFRPDTGHYYLVSGTTADWNAAIAAADGATLGSMQGYLATVTSLQENVFVSALVPAFPPFPPPRLWLGGTDEVTEGAWLWLGGPEAGQQFWSGGPAGSEVNGMFAGWGAAQPQAADYLTILGTGDWEAVAGTGSYRYLVEFGGTPDQTEDGLNAIVMLGVVDRNDAPVLDNAGAMTLDTLFEDDLANGGTRIADLIASAGGDRITDADPGAVEGIALIGLDTAHGAWQFSIDGGLTWQNVGSVSASHALLLRAGDFLRFQPVADFAGTLDAAITFRAWDQTAGSAGSFADTSTSGGQTAFSLATDTAALSVQNVPDAPRSGVGVTDQEATEDAPFSYAVPADAFTDPDPGDVLTYSATLADGSPLPAWLTFDPSTRTFFGTPGDDGVGTWNVRVIATDASGAHAADAFTLHVANVNDAPHTPQALGDVRAAEDAPLVHMLPADAFADVDPDDALTFSATLADGAPLPQWLAFDPATRTFSGTPRNEDVGTLVIRVTATDAHGASAAQLFGLEVENTNDAPHVARPLTDQSVTEGTLLHIRLPADTFRDPDAGDVLTYSAALADGGPLPSWLRFDPLTGTFSGTPLPGAAGVLRVRVTASDGDGAAAALVFTLEVRAAPDPYVPNRGGGGSEGGGGTSDGGGAVGPDGGGGGAEDGGSLPGDAGLSPVEDGGESGPDNDMGAADGGDQAEGASEAAGAGDGEGDGTDGSPAEAAAETVDGGPGGGGGSGEPGGGGLGTADRAVLPEAAEGGGADAQRRAREDEPLPAGELLLSDFDAVLLRGDLYSDVTQPAEFRAAWQSILSAYTDSGDEVVAYLESAFRTVTESAYIHQAADAVIHRLEEELALAAEAGLEVDASALVADVRTAAADVKLASRELEAAILAAADAGRAARFDQALEDVIHASLNRLMLANERLFVASQALAAATGVIQQARAELGEPAASAAGREPSSESPSGVAGGARVLDARALAEVAALARDDARAQITEMRESWDRVAEDVFRAFVSRLVQQQAEEGGGR